MMQMTQSGLQKSKERGKKCFEKMKLIDEQTGFSSLRAQHVAGPGTGGPAAFEELIHDQ